MEKIKFSQIAGHSGCLGVIELNRCEALNAIDHSMILALTKQLKKWQINTDIKAVIIRSNCDKSFSAGGDIRQIYNIGKTRLQSSLEFFQHEYQLNYLISQYSKPYISFLNGITMGGGVGISMHGSHPIVTEHFSFAMPETAIGFFPDIGGSYLLNQCPGQLGTYLALSSTRLSARDTVYAQLSRYYLASQALESVYQRILHSELGPVPKQTVTQIIEQQSSTIDDLQDTTEIQAHQSEIDNCFKYDQIERIIDALTVGNTAWHLKTRDILLQKSPTSLKVTLALMRHNKNKTLSDCLKLDYQLSHHFLTQTDFYEGVRAFIIDKDKQPQWQPNHLNKISTKNVDQFFKTINNAQLLLD